MDRFGGHVEPPGLRFEQSARADGVVCLAVVGEIDMTSGDRFRAAISAAVEEAGTKQLLLDLSGLTFMDSNGVAVLVKSQRSAREQGVEFGIVNASVPIRSVLQIMGVYDMLAVDA